MKRGLFSMEIFDWNFCVYCENSFCARVSTSSQAMVQRPHSSFLPMAARIHKDCIFLIINKQTNTCVKSREALILKSPFIFPTDVNYMIKIWYLLF